MLPQAWQVVKFQVNDLDVVLLYELTDPVRLTFDLLRAQVKFPPSNRTSAQSCGLAKNIIEA
jgi:hypothetical protein